MNRDVFYEYRRKVKAINNLWHHIILKKDSACLPELPSVSLLLYYIKMCRSNRAFYWCHDVRHNDTQHKDTQHNWLVCDTYHKIHSALWHSVLNVIMLSVTNTYILCWVSLCRMSVCWVFWRPSIAAPLNQTKLFNWLFHPLSAPLNKCSPQMDRQNAYRILSSVMHIQV
jgi:hypothetical protein